MNKFLFVSMKTHRNVIKDRKNPIPVSVESVATGQVCEKCNSNLRLDVHTLSGRAVGVAGLHVRRFMCGCGCSAVEFFHVVSSHALAPRRTASLMYLPHNEHETAHYESTWGKIFKLAEVSNHVHA